MLDSLFGNINVMQASLQGLSARQRVIGENVANADTPGYKRMEVTYEAQLRRAIKQDQDNPGDLAMKTSSARHFTLGPSAGVDGVSPLLFQVRDESYRNDKNNVDIELEMAKLAETNIRYNTMATLARKDFEGLRNVVREIR